MSTQKTLLLLLPVGMDDWSRALYKGSDGWMYVDVDGTPHTMSPDWEPDSPLVREYQIVSKHDWDQAMGR